MARRKQNLFFKPVIRVVYRGMKLMVSERGHVGLSGGRCPPHFATLRPPVGILIL